MAGAGFLFTPHEPGDDTAKCFYCGIELSGWDPDDDPVYVLPIYHHCISSDVTREEHRRRIAKRGTECPFFTARITELPEKKKTVRRTTSKASLQTQKTPRTRSTKVPDPESDSDEQEVHLWRSTRLRTARAAKTPVRASARSTAAARSGTASSIAETDEPSGSDVVEVAKPKAKGSKRKAKDETPMAEEDGSEEIAIPLRKSTRAKKTRDIFEDIEVDVNFEELRPNQAQLRRSTRSKSKAPAEGSDSDVSVKSVRSTRSTRSTKNTKSAATKSKGKTKAQPVVEETEEEDDMPTPIQTPKKTTRAVAPPKSTKGRKVVRKESIESESSEVPPPPPKLPQSTAKSRRKIIESESEEWQSAKEDVAPTPRPSTTKKARGRPPKATKTPKALPKPPPAPLSPTLTSNASHVSESYMSESELHTPMREISKAKKPTAKTAVQPFHEKPSGRNHALAESRAQPLAPSRFLSIGSKENADDRDTVIIDASDDEDDTRRFVTSKSMMSNSTSSNPPKVNGVSANVAPKPKSTMAKKRESFIGVVLSSSPRVTHQSTKARGKMAERSWVDMDVDEVMVLDQPSRSAETDHDSPVALDKGKAKATTGSTKPKSLSSASKQDTSKQKRERKAVIQSEASDSAMDVDDREGYGVQDVQSIRDLRQPSTPRRDPPRKLFGGDSNPFTTAPPQQDSNDATNPLSAFEAPYGRLPAEVIYALAEEEKEMLVEEWTKRELEIQLELFKEHGLRKIREFKERAAEARRHIEAL